MSHLEVYIDDPQKWDKFITADMEGKVPFQIGRGKMRAPYIPLSSADQGATTSHPVIVSPMQGVVMRAESELQHQRNQLRANEIPMPTGPVKRAKRKPSTSTANSKASYKRGKKSTTRQRGSGGTGKKHKTKKPSYRKNIFE